MGLWQLGRTEVIESHRSGIPWATPIRNSFVPHGRPRFVSAAENLLKNL